MGAAQGQARPADFPADASAQLDASVAKLRSIAAQIDTLVDSDNLLVRVETRRIKDILRDLLYEVDLDIPPAA